MPQDFSNCAVAFADGSNVKIGMTVNAWHDKEKVRIQVWVGGGLVSLQKRGAMSPSKFFNIGGGDEKSCCLYTNAVFFIINLQRSFWAKPFI